MNLQEAKKIIENDSSSFSDWVYASGVITSSKESSLADLVLCLKRRGVPAEMAATTLYVRTKRARKDDSISSIILDAEDWNAYIKEHFSES